MHDCPIIEEKGALSSGRMNRIRLDAENVLIARIALPYIFPILNSALNNARKGG
jgi:hypothetical protein